MSTEDQIQSSREPAREVAPLERIAGFGPVDLGYTDDEAVLEAGRCLQCKKAPCRSGCPVGVNIPAMVERVRARDWAGALETVHADNLLPSICGRVCSQETQCEGKCVLGRRGEPLAIGQLERFVGDKAAGPDSLGGSVPAASDEPAAPVSAAPASAAPTVTKGEEPLGRVAVVGSGPAGLTCALELARAGVEVTLFESLHRLGGVLTYGIPPFRLPDAVVERELAALSELHITVAPNTVVGRLMSVDELLDEQGFDAVFLGVGAGLPKLLNVPGENLAGVFCANEYLTRVNLMHAYKFPNVDTPVRSGANVIVFGGGNVAMDAARTALRLGAQSVRLAYRRTEAEMPARRAEIEHAKAEGVEFLELVAPESFIGDERGNVTAARLTCMQLGEPDSSGRRRPVPLEGDDALLELPCDTVVSAIGTNASPLVNLMAPGITLNEHGYITINDAGRTTDPRIWAGGDIVTGSATVILAMGAGKRAAADILATLRASA